LLIFPEGKRSRTGELLPFHPGAAILALGARVPVAPIYIRGAMDILPPGHQRSRPAPVHVSIGRPIWFPEDTSVADARQAMEDAVRALMPGEPDSATPELVLSHGR
jgi:1-acyl-sn-glycerol-3-phosphate acyltransferase